MWRYILIINGNVTKSGKYKDKEDCLDDVFMYLNEYCKEKFEDINLIIKEEK